jgi:hypothetical protein
VLSDPLSISISGDTLFQVLASTGDTQTAWQVPVIYEGQAPSAALVIGPVTTPLGHGRQEISGTGGTVSLAATYDARTQAKFGANPYRQSGTQDGYPLKTVILDGGRQFAFTDLVFPVLLPVNLTFNLDAPGAVVQLLVNDANAGFIPQGASEQTVTGFNVGFFVSIKDPQSTVSLVWQYETPTARWPLTGTDASAALGRLGASSAALIQSRSEADDQVIAVLWARDGGLNASWIAAQNPLPGGWTPEVTDVYLGAGDLDGDGNAETLVLSKKPGLGGRAGVLRYDSATGGLTTAAVAKDQIPGGWNIDVLDTWVPIGAIDPTGRARLLVQSQYDGLDHVGSVGLVYYDTTLRSLYAVSIASGSIPGGWTIANVCSYVGADTDGYIGAGDIDNDGLAEIVAWTRNPDSDRVFAVLDNDPTRRGLKTAWLVKGTVPGDPVLAPAGWLLDAADNAVPAGAIIDPGRVGVLLQRTSPLLPPALAHVRFDLSSRGVVTWLQTGSLGPWQLAPTDLLLPLGDVDGDGRTEVLIRDQPLTGPCSLALLRYDQKNGITAASKITGSIGAWTLSADDAFTALGDIDGDGRTEILLRDTTDTGPNHAALLRWNPNLQALTIAWQVQGAIPGVLL